MEHISGIDAKQLPRSKPLRQRQSRKNTTYNDVTGPMNPSHVDIIRCMDQAKTSKATIGSRFHYGSSIPDDDIIAAFKSGIKRNKTHEDTSKNMDNARDKFGVSDCILHDMLFAPPSEKLVHSKKDNNIPFIASDSSNRLETGAKSHDDVQAMSDSTERDWSKCSKYKLKQLIQTCLNQYLEGKTYDSEECSKWSKDIANTIRTNLQELGYTRYRFVTQVIIGEQRSSHMKFGCRCVWDADTDCYIQDIFSNESLYCIVAVFAVLFY